MKKLRNIIILACLAFQLNGQSSGISVTGGIGTYDLSDLKVYQEELISKLPVEARGFNHFPNYTNIRINLFRQRSNGFRYGLTYAFSTTGAHSNYTDYSGYLNLDQTISSYQFGVSGAYRLLDLDFTATTLEIMGYGDLRLGYVRDEVSMYITTAYYFENNNLRLSTVSPMAELGLDAMFRFTKLSLGVSGGYMYDAGTKFKAGEPSSLNQSVSLRPSGEYHSGLSGFRAGIKAILWFNNELVIE